MGALLFGMLFIVVGAVLIWVDRKVFWDGWRSRDWVKVRATIVECADTSFKIDGANQSGGSVVKYAECEWHYRYEWEGVEYRGRTFCFGANVDQPLDAMWEGHQFMVYCNPQCPTESVIKPGLGYGAIVPLICLALGICRFVTALVDR